MPTDQQDNIAVRDDRNRTKCYTSSALLTHAPQSSVGSQPGNTSMLRYNRTSQKTTHPSLLNRYFSAIWGEGALPQQFQSIDPSRLNSFNGKRGVRSCTVSRFNTLPERLLNTLLSTLTVLTKRTMLLNRSEPSSLKSPAHLECNPENR